LNLTEEQMIERIRSAIPLGRWGEASDIANAVAFLCSTEAAWITGEVLRVSGGSKASRRRRPSAPEYVRRAEPDRFLRRDRRRLRCRLARGS